MRKENSDEDISTFSLRSPSSINIPVTMPYEKPKQVIVDSVEKSAAKMFKNNSSSVNTVNRFDAIGTAIMEWPNAEVWPFKLGIPILGLAAGATGFFINQTFRKALYLEHFSKLSSYIVSLGFPTFTLGLSHGWFVTADIFAEKTPCPVCVQVKAAVVQSLLGLVYPVLCVPLVSYSTASALKDVHLPKLTKNPREVFEFTKQVYRPIMGKLRFIAAAQIILAMGVTYLEQECFYTKILPVLNGDTKVKNPYDN